MHERIRNARKRNQESALQRMMEQHAEAAAAANRSEPNARGNAEKGRDAMGQQTSIVRRDTEQGAAASGGKATAAAPAQPPPAPIRLSDLEARDREVAMNKYREILAAGSVATADAATFREVMRILGKSHEDVSKDGRVLSRATQLADHLATSNGLQGRCSDATEAVAHSNQKRLEAIKLLNEEHRKVVEDQLSLQQQVIARNESRAELHQLRQAHPVLLANL